MMRVAFYAPLKPPTHPVPSGDRRMARLLLAAIRRTGHDVFVASEMRAFDGAGDPRAQERIRRRGNAIAARLIERYRKAPPDLWFTYHLYHKAPDWIGPAVCRALAIPYVVAEASIAPKRAGGPWRAGYDAVRDAVGQAAAIVLLNPDDRECVVTTAASPDRLAALPPFIDTAPPRRAAARRNTLRTEWANRLGIPADEVWIVVVAMMRHGDKLESYRVLGRAMERLVGLPLRWLVAGDGSARPEVERALRAASVTWLDMVDRTTLDSLNASADLAVWPAIREAFGMAMLEAQAAGLPVVAGNSPGVAQIVADGETGLLTPPGDDTMLADAVRALATDGPTRRRMGQAAMDKAQREHDLGAAAARLSHILQCAKAISA
jgi:glycosyltransferase involved in cell wall biosynthesis